MEDQDLLDLIAADESPAQISDLIKDIIKDKAFFEAVSKEKKYNKKK